MATAFRPDGTTRSGTWLFAGRFHPLLLHLPIALALLVPVMEWLGRSPRRAELKTAAGFVLGLACAAALVAAGAGWLLGRRGGYQGSVVLSHMWGGLLFATACQLAATLRVPLGEMPAGNRWAYRFTLAGALGLLVWASDNGGNLSHGPTFLTEYMPLRVQRLLGVHTSASAHPNGLVSSGSSVQAGPTVYLKRIQPMLDRSCVSCHGPHKVKGKLRLDSYAALIKGGDSGPEVVPWNPEKSELLRRVTLPSDDDDFMPGSGKNPLTPAQIKELRVWVAAGASDRQPLLTPGLK